MDNIRIFFVLSKCYSKESEAAQPMLEAYEQCKQNISTTVKWVKENELQELNVSKTDFIVFEEFEGECFQKLQESKCARILGPWAVSVCLMEGKPIPNFPWPIYNVAMYDCIVTCSHLSKVVKTEIKEKVEKMGGCYIDTLLAKNTHLITGSAKSEKYLMAAEAGVKLMLPSWVEEVWQISQGANVHANDEIFNKHHCLPFQNLVICSTGISSGAERKKLEKLVNDNGGTFTGKLNLANTDILVCCGENSTSSDKYKAARQQKHLKCVNFSWITDSIQHGYALPHINYQVQKMTSTPTKPDEPVNPEFSILSAIGGPNSSQRAFVEETLASPFSPVNNRNSAKRKASVPEYESMLENIDIKKAKRAGQYLDGCSVYITGFGAEHTEKLNKIINLSGATRYNSFSDRVTHVIVGDPHFHEVKLIMSKQTSTLVTLQWLLDSIESGQPAPEEKYLLSFTDMDESDVTSSPLSKKGLNLLRSSRTITEKEFNENMNNPPQFQEQSDNSIVQQYLRQSTATEEDTLAKLLEGADNSNFAKPIVQRPKETYSFKPPDMSASLTQDGTSEIPTQFFENLKFLVMDFEEEEHLALKKIIEEFSGELVSKTYKGIPDFLVVPAFNDKEIHQTATEIVNDFFIYECQREEELVKQIEYYHRPFSLPQSKPLQNCVITLSSYSGCERMFLRSLIESIGGVAQEQFARVTAESKGVIASTHLVTFEATGKKYEAALKWGLPVVKKEWLLECYKSGKRLPETQFLIGNSKAPELKDISSLNTSVAQEQAVPSAHDVSSMNDRTQTASLTPSRQNRVLTPVNQVTPFYRRYRDSTEKPFTQVTPINKIMQNFRESNLMLNDSAPKETKEYIVPQPWMNIKTPDTPLGAFLTPNPSPGLRKQWEYWLRQFPDNASPKSTASTPLSEIKKKLWNKVLKTDGVCQPNFDDSTLGDSNENIESSSNVETPKTPENQQLADRLQQLEDMLIASGGGSKRQSSKFQATIPTNAKLSDYKDSQTCTVGWDYQEQTEPKKTRIFSLSGVADEATRSKMVRQIEQLGGYVSDLSNYDPTCTHLLCPKPARNEKSLSCMAAGKWVLHVSYLDKSVEAGHFLDEDIFEFGNPKALGNFSVASDRETELRMHRMHWWRKEISKRGYKAFNDMRAIVVAQKREPIVRVIEAGGGKVIDLRPPFEDTVHVTHCLLEQKSVQDFSLYVPLAKQGVYLVNTVFISDYLHNPNKDIRECILPYFSKYYGRD